jgi:hypothetical protein
LRTSGPAGEAVPLEEAPLGGIVPARPQGDQAGLPVLQFARDAEWGPRCTAVPIVTYRPSHITLAALTSKRHKSTNHEDHEDHEGLDSGGDRVSTSGSLLHALRGFRGFLARLTADWYHPLP